MSMESSSETQFEVDGIRAIELAPNNIPVLPQFFEDNADYFLICNGEPPAADAAHQEYYDELPPGWSYTKKWMLGYFDDAGTMIAMANVVSDLIAAHVWHLGL